MAVSTRAAKLKEHILSEQISLKLVSELKKNTGTDDFFTVFISVCNKKERARVFHGSGKTIRIAWGNAERRLDEFLKGMLKKKKPFSPVWVKADVVTHFEEIDTTDLNKKIIENKWHNFTRLGISFDKGFRHALLEAEIHGNKMLKYVHSQEDILTGKIDYTRMPIELGNVNKYLKTTRLMPPLAEVPEKITVFTAQGYFCGEDSIIRELYSDSVDYGRRKIDIVDDNVIREILTGASEYLVRLIDDNGRFIYGYYPIFGAMMRNYNIIRHTSTIWSIINLYRMSGDKNLIPKLEKAISYMDGCTDHIDAETAYLVEMDDNEIKLGANGVAIIMYTEYMDVFKTDKYVGIVRKLANGILRMQDPQTGKYYHVLNYPDYSGKEEFRIIYYDGEATFALTRAFTYTNETKYLDAAKAAVENFIRSDYTIHRDHWVAYSLLEVTKHISDVRYYDFALKNVDENLQGIHQRETSFHTYLELLMAGWQTYKNALNEGIESCYIKNYDPTGFAQTIYHRVRHMLNGFFYPEYAMYMKFPDTIVGSFHVRHHNYRVRIDDMQHFIGGYYYYCLYYNEILPYLTVSR